MAKGTATLDLGTIIGHWLGSLAGDPLKLFMGISIVVLAMALVSTHRLLMQLMPKSIEAIERQTAAMEQAKDAIERQVAAMDALKDALRGRSR